MVDIHCHILPNIDDGSRSWEISEKMVDVAAGDGITHIVATPHANGQYQYDRKRFTELLLQLQGRVGGKIAFSLGCDFHMSFENLAALFAGPEQYVIGDTRYLLIELNDYSIPP